MDHRAPLDRSASPMNVVDYLHIESGFCLIEKNHCIGVERAEETGAIKLRMRISEVPIGLQKSKWSQRSIKIRYETLRA